MPQYLSPGLYPEDVQSVAPPEFYTGVPVLLGFVARGHAQELTHPSQFPEQFGDPVEGCHLAYAVRGFFENGGQTCCVVPVDGRRARAEAIAEGLQVSRRLDKAD